jgi:23S rRNA pseudouridine1911/1915/1917 synthase
MGRKIMKEILYEDNHLLVVVKKPNIPVQSDDSGDLDLLTELKEYLKKKYQKPGNVYLGLIHRLDRPVGGIMVFAKTSKAAGRLSEQVRSRKIEKKYLALVYNKFDKREGKLIDYIIKDPITFSSKITDKKIGQEAIMEYKVLNYDSNTNFSIVEINLLTGRHHQIRVQLTNFNHPIFGDQRYGPEQNKVQIHLWASNLKFSHPITNEIMSFKNLPNWYQGENYE